MKLYLISQKVNDSYDTYLSAVVAAENEEQAKHIHPSGMNMNWQGCDNEFPDWGLCLDDIVVEYLGEAYKPDGPIVICVNYNL